MPKFRPAPEIAAAADMAEKDRPAALRRRTRELEARLHQLEDGIRRALLVHAQGSEACFCPLCSQLRGLIFDEKPEETRPTERRRAS
jgi:hypothetical protein